MLDLGESSDENVVALARHQRSHREQRNDRPPRTRLPRDLVGSGLHHAQTLPRNLEILGEDPHCRRTRDHDMPGAFQGGQLASVQSSSLLRALSCFERERVVHQRDEAMTSPQHLRRLGNSPEGESIDDDEALPGECRKLPRGGGTRRRRGPRKAVAEIDQADFPAEVC
jgi:hypothetical protein